MAQDRDVTAKSWTTTVDGKVRFCRLDNGDVVITVHGPAPEHMLIATRTVPAEDWAFIRRTVR